MPHQPSPVRPMLGGRDRQSSLYAYGNTIVTPLGVDNGECEKPPTVDGKLGLALAGPGVDRDAVEQPNPGQCAALGLDREGAVVGGGEGEFGTIRTGRG